MDFLDRLDLLSQSWQTLYEAAAFAVTQEHWLAAEPLLQKVLEKVPNHASAHHLLGKVLYANNELELALAEQKLSCELDPSIGWNWFAAGELFLELGRWTEAVEAFEQALSMLPAELWIREQLAAANWQLQCKGGTTIRWFRY